MTKRANTVKSGRILKVVSSLVAVGVAIGGPAACSEPQIRCAAQDGEAIAYYKLLSTSGDCGSAALPNLPGSDPSTFPIGVESYVPTPSDPNAANEVGSIALQPEWLGARVEDAQLNAATDPTLASSKVTFANYPYGTATAPTPPPTGAPSTNFPYAWGKFDTVFPDADGICHVSNMTVSKVTYPDIPVHLASIAVASPLGSPTYITATAGASVTTPPATTCTDGTNGTTDNSAIVCTAGGPCIGGLCTTPCAQDSDCPSDQACMAVGTDNICEVPDNPATTVTYTWSDIRVYVAATAVGLQTWGNLTVTQDSCTAKYSVAILVPRVLCANANDSTVEEDSLCSADANGIDNPFGSGIAEGIATKCTNIGSSGSPDYECLPEPADKDPLGLLP